MKKRILLFIMMLFLIVSCGKKGADPAEVLKNVYQNHKDLSSYTTDLTLNVNVGAGDDSTMSIPVKMTLVYDNQNNNDTSDDQVYVDMGASVLGQSMHYETWIKDGKMYMDDGTNKTVSEMENYVETMQSFTNADVADAVKKLTDNLESLHANPKDKGLEIVMKPKESLFTDILSSSVFSQIDQFADYDLESLKEIMKGLKMSDIVMTIDENQLLKDMSTAFSMNYQEVDLLADLSMSFRDYNRSKIPAFNENDFIAASSTDIIDVEGNEGDDSYDYDGSYIDIVFDNDSTEIYVFMDQPDKYYIYYDEEDYFITIYDENFEPVVDGLFITNDFAKEMQQEFDTNKTDFVIRSTASVDASFTDGSIVIGYSNTDNDYFNPDTPFSLITFDGCPYAIVFVGYETEEAFKTVMDQTSYMIYIEE